MERTAALFRRARNLENGSRHSLLALPTFFHITRLHPAGAKQGRTPERPTPGRRRLGGWPGSRRLSRRSRAVGNTQDRLHFGLAQHALLLEQGQQGEVEPAQVLHLGAQVGFRSGHGPQHRAPAQRTCRPPSSGKGCPLRQVPTSSPTYIDLPWICAAEYAPV